MNSNKKSMLALKGALLLVLAVQVSWKPAVDTLHSMDLLSSGEVKNVQTSPYTTNGGETQLPVSKDSLKPQTNNTATITIQTVPNEDQNSGLVSDDPTAITDPYKACGIRLSVTYTEIKDEGRTKTEIYVAPMFEGEKAITDFSFKVSGTLDNNHSNDDLRSAIEDSVTTRVKAILAKKNVACKETSTADRGDSSDKESVDPKKIKEDQKRCLVDKNGEKLEGEERLSCNLDRLNSLSIDDETDRKQTSYLMKEIENIVHGDLKKILRTMIVSSEDDQVEQATDAISEIQDAIQQLAETYRLDPTRMRRLAGELDAMKAGGDTYRESVSKKEDVNSLRDDMRQLRDEMKGAMDGYRKNPSDQYAMMQVMMLQQQNQMLMQQYGQLQSSISNDVTRGPLAQLNQARNMGLVDFSDYQFYSKPYMTLQTDLAGLLNGSTLGTPSNTGVIADPSTGPVGAIPADLYTYRTGLATAFRRNYGVAPVLTRPTLPNLGNFGSNAVSVSRTGFDLGFSPMNTQFMVTPQSAGQQNLFGDSYMNY